MCVGDVPRQHMGATGGHVAWRAAAVVLGTAGGGGGGWCWAGVRVVCRGAGEVLPRPVCV